MRKREQEQAADFEEIALRKKLQRAQDEADLASGKKTREQLQRENSLFAPFDRSKIVVHFKDAKPLR